MSKTINELKHEVEVKEAEKAAIYSALAEIQKTHEAVLKQYEDAMKAVNDAKVAYVEAMQSAS